MKSIDVSEAKPSVSKPSLARAKPAQVSNHPGQWMSQPLNLDRISRDLRHMIDQMSSSLWHNPFYPAAMLGNGNGFHMHALVPFPEINLSETDTAVEITAELPGMTQEDIDLSLANGFLTIKGAKQEGADKEEVDYHLSERRFGAFERMVLVPDGIDTNAIKATLSHGVLTVTLPKTKEAQTSQRKIPIAAGSA